VALVSDALQVAGFPLADNELGHFISPRTTSAMQVRTIEQAIKKNESV
jgi:hypothetical protein